MISMLTQAQEIKVSSGTIKSFKNFPSNFVDPRNIDVWLPNGYNEKEKYPVLYMHDGQMLFDPEMTWNKQAWQVLRRWQKPFLTAFGDSDPITGGAEKLFQREVPGCKDQAHVTIKGAGHFIQETHGEELARTIVAFIGQTPLTK